MDFNFDYNVIVKSGILITPSSSGINVILAVEKLSSDQSSLTKKRRGSLKLPEGPLELKRFFNSATLAWLTDKDNILKPLIKALEDKTQEQTTKLGRYS